MANVEVRDGDEAEKFFKATGAGSDADPFIPEHKETSAAAALTALQLIDDGVATTGSAITAKGMAAAGTDGTNARILKTDASGELQIDVLTIAAGDNNIGNVDVVSFGDGSNTITLLTAGADAVNNTSNRVPVGAWTYGFNGTSWDRLRTAIVAVTSAFTGMLNMIPVIVYNTSNPAPTNGQGGPLQGDSALNLKVNPGIYNSAPVQTSVTVTTDSTQLLAANASRTGAIIQNQSTLSELRVALDGGAAAVDGTCYRQGIWAASTPPLRLDHTMNPNTALFAIGVSTSCTVHITEFS